jgi:hypothetical protein
VFIKVPGRFLNRALDIHTTCSLNTVSTVTHRIKYQNPQEDIGQSINQSTEQSLNSKSNVINQSINQWKVRTTNQHAEF